MANEFVMTYGIAGLGTITGEQFRNLSSLGSAPMADTSGDPGVYRGDTPEVPVAGDLFVYYDDGVAVDNETYKPEVTSDNEIEAEAIIEALKSSDGWLTNTGSGTLTFKQIITILTAWAAGKVEDDGSGNYSILDPEDDATVIYKLTTVSETSPYKDTDIG